jgi:hypothetical protein
MLAAAEESNLSVDCIIKFRAAQYDKIREFLREIDEREKQDVPHKMTLRINCKISNLLILLCLPCSPLKSIEKSSI